MRGATFVDELEQRRVGLWAGLAMVAVAVLLSVWVESDRPQDDGWKPVEGALTPTWTRFKNGHVEYRIDDLGMVCRYRPLEWDKPVCEEVGK